MKKYVKPELFYEHFELSTHIANCILEPHTNSEPVTCQFKADADSEWPNEIVFAGGCEMEIACYYTGGDGVNTFNS